jgi:hypothetical protein
MADQHMCVSIYTSYEQVTDAVALLQASGFDMGLLSLLARDDWRVPQQIGPFRSGGAIAYGGTRGGFWERTWGVMPGRGGLWIFESGPLLLAGRIVRTMIAEEAQTPSDWGPESLNETLSRVGIPVSNVSQYGTELTNHRLLLFVEGDLETVDRAQRALEGTKTLNHTLHHGASD